MVIGECVCGCVGEGAVLIGALRYLVREVKSPWRCTKGEGGALLNRSKVRGFRTHANQVINIHEHSKVVRRSPQEGKYRVRSPGKTSVKRSPR